MPRPLIEQNEKAKAVVKRIDLNDFSVYQFANPGKGDSFETDLFSYLIYLGCQ